MTFRVEPESLRRYAAQMSDLSKTAETAKSYLNQWGALAPYELGFFGFVWRRHPNYVDRLNEMLARVTALAAASSDSLTNAAKSYETTDSQSAAELDASYPAAPRPMIFQG